MPIQPTSPVLTVRPRNAALSAAADIFVQAALATFCDLQPRPADDTLSPDELAQVLSRATRETLYKAALEIACARLSMAVRDFCGESECS